MLPDFLICHIESKITHCQAKSRATICSDCPCLRHSDWRKCPLKLWTFPFTSTEDWSQILSIRPACKLVTSKSENIWKAPYYHFAGSCVEDASLVRVEVTLLRKHLLSVKFIIPASTSLILWEGWPQLKHVLLQI